VPSLYSSIRKTLAEAGEKSDPSPEGASSNDSHRCSQLIERASDGQSAFGEDMGIDHRRPDVAVAQEFLDGTDVVALFQKTGCERMPERMATAVLGDSGTQDCGLHRALEHTFVDVVSAFEAFLRVCAAL
jgi:hypothetical protein